MKLKFLVLLTIAAFLIMAAFRSAIRQTDKAGIAEKVIENKKFSIRCSPVYIPTAADDIPLLSGWG